MSVEVLTVSSKGQIVLPAAIRKALSILSGDKLAAYAVGDTIMLKPIKVPTEEDFITWMGEMRDWATDVGYTEEDVAAIIKDVRRERRERRA